ncbi:hypothetical protein BH24ACT15_BH24ACT15_03840 [soil metagenome]
MTISSRTGAGWADATSGEDSGGWLAFLCGVTARGLSGVRLATSHAHAGLVACDSLLARAEPV